MKRLFISMTLALMLVTATAFANDEVISKKAITAFHSSFSNVTEVKWSKLNDLYVASFVLNNLQVSAYYDAQGVLVATGRYITYQQLPVVLLSGLEERKKDFRVTGFMEVSNEDGTVYYANLENEKESLLLKSTSANSWNIYKRKHK